MDNDASSNPQTPPSELGAYEAIEKPVDESAESVTCPVCGRSVEKGFRFCDGCGNPLESAEPKPPPPPPVVQTEVPRTQEAKEESGSIVDRWRRRRAERSELAEAERTLAQGPPRLDATPEVIDLPEAPSRPVGATSRPIPADELRGARPAIGGRLQWSEDTGKTVEPSWLPRAIPTQADVQGRAFRPARFALYVAIGFVAGAVVLGLITVVATLVSEGSVAILQMRGLPIFVAGVVSVVVFALLASGRRSPASGATRASTIATVGAGLAILIVLAAIVYQPGVAARVQPRIDRALGVFSGADEEAVDGFRQDIIEWNEDSAEYHGLLEASLRRGIDFNRFRQRAADFEGNLVDLVAQMRAHARGAQNPDLRDVLDDLASVYEDQLGGLRVVNRGILIDQLNLVGTGDRRYDDARRRAGALFTTRLRPVLVRAGFDAQAFGDALGGE
jgi:hypothetical protein